MKQKFKNLILLGGLLISSFSASAYDFESDGIYYNINIVDKTVSVTNGKNLYIGNINIPSSVIYAGQNLPVVEIDKNAFQNCRDLISIDLPNSIVSIGEGAFSECMSLSAVNIPNSLTEIKEETFRYCTNLTSLEIPESVIIIGKKVFEECKKLESIRIPDSVIQLGEASFWNCKSLKTITLSKSLTTIEKSTFVGCSSIIELEIPNSVTTIGEYAFQNCNNLTSVQFPISLTTIEKYAFWNCESLKSVNTPDTLVTIGSYAFQGCSNLNNIILSEFVTEIKPYTFSGCKNLISIKIPDACTRISDYAFAECVSLNVVNISNSVIEINQHSFENCKSLTNLTIPESVIYIGNFAFNGCDNIEYLYFEDSQEDIQLRANVNFGSNLKNLYIGRNIINIDKNNPFRNCIDINSLSLGKFVKSVVSTLPLSMNELNEIYSYSSNPPLVDNFSNDNYARAIVNIPYGSLGEYQSNPVWGNFWHIEESLPYPEIVAKEIVLNLEEVELTIEETIQLEAKVLPEDTTDKTITWSSSNEKIANVSGNGLVKALLSGSVNITASCGEVFATCKINVINPIVEAESIKLNIEEAELYINETLQLEATVLPENTTNKAVIWQSSNNDVASVNESGLVTAISEGIATITAINGNISTTCQITVLTPIIEAEQIILNFESAELNIGETVQLEATVLPEDTTDKSLSWNSSDSNIATVNENGLVKAISAGTVIITAACGEVSADCVVTVLEDAGVESLLANPDTIISIYTTDGILIKKDCKVDDLKTLNKGIYIIVSGKEHYKISI